MSTLLTVTKFVSLYHSICPPFYVNANIKFGLCLCNSKGTNLYGISGSFLLLIKRVGTVISLI